MPDRQTQGSYCLGFGETGVHLLGLGMFVGCFFGGWVGVGGFFISARNLRTLNPTSTGGGGVFWSRSRKVGELDISLANWGAWGGGGGGMTLLGKVSETWKLHINLPLFRPEMFLV